MARLVDEAFRRVREREEDRLSFCVAFALFEYALKECIPAADRGGIAWPNWPEFERRQPPLDAAPNLAPETLEAIQYVLGKPPKVQYAVYDRASYRDKPLAGTGNAPICEALKRIRNNLFHGGKEPYTEDDARKVRAGLEIIDGYLSANGDLRSAFERGMA